MAAAESPIVAERLYFGSEFCQTLLPAPQALHSFMDSLAPTCKGVSVRIPPLTNDGHERLASLLSAIAPHRGAIDVELVVNDWGTLAWLAEREVAPPVVLGRLACKLLRDPRIPVETWSGAGLPGIAAIRESSLASAPHLEVLRQYRVERVEIDVLRQGLDIDFRALRLRPTVHLPFGYVTSGRICQLAGLGHPERDRFVPGTPCRHECRRFFAAMPRPNESSLLLFGNTVFTKHDRHTIALGLGMAETAGGRVVFHTAPFSEVAYATEDMAEARRWLEEC